MVMGYHNAPLDDYDRIFDDLLGGSAENLKLPSKKELKMCFSEKWQETPLAMSANKAEYDQQ